MKRLSADYTAPFSQPDGTGAPEEPNVYRSVVYPKTCAPAEREFREAKTGTRFAPLERGEYFGRRFL